MAIASECHHSISSLSEVEFLLGKDFFTRLLFRQGYLFEHEITDEIAPKYHLFIRRPIALDTIRKTLESNDYPTKEVFKRDVFLMLYNAMKYNPRFHHVHRSAKSLFQQALPLFNLSPEDIQGQITRRSSISSASTSNNNNLTTTTTETPAAKRKRIKVNARLSLSLAKIDGLVVLVIRSGQLTNQILVRMKLIFSLSVAR